MEEKVRFVYDYERDEQTMADLCAGYGISRETGYVWLRRYRKHGLAGLVELGRRPQWSPQQTAREVEEAVLELRQAHMRWGPRKLKRVLERDQPGRAWPAASTIGEMVKRAGLVVGRKRRRRTEPYTDPLAHAHGPNRVWCADFKGWFRAQNGERIDPLTITDAYSRYLLRCQVVEKTDTERVRAILEAAFREYGLPEAIRTDNGAPFASAAIAGLSRLSVWLIKLGVVPERIEAGHPEQNGRHERMHRTLKQALQPAADRRAQQHDLDQFRQEYNEVRPHEALNMETPASVYAASAREYPRRVEAVEYPDAMVVRAVEQNGCFYWRKRQVFLTEVLWGERIGLLPIHDGVYAVYFAQLELATFDVRTLKVTPIKKNKSFINARAGEGDASPSPAPHPLHRYEHGEKVSGMSPV